MATEDKKKSELRKSIHACTVDLFVWRLVLGRGGGVVVVRCTHCSANDAPKRVPCTFIKPVPKLIEAVVCQLCSRAVVEPIIPHG